MGEFVVDIGPLLNYLLLTGKQMNMSSEYWKTWMKDKLIEKFISLLMISNFRLEKKKKINFGYF
jgi:hypothetical protein